MEGFYVAIGAVMLGTTVHFFILQNSTTWADRKGYQKFSTCMAIFTFISMWMAIAK